MFKPLRGIDKDNKPSLSLSTLIYIPTDGETTFCAKPCKSDLRRIVEAYLPEVSEGKARLLIAWEGQWRTDIFEVTKETVSLFESIVQDYVSETYKH